MWAFLGYYYLGKFAFECDEMGHEVIFRWWSLIDIFLLFATIDVKIWRDFIKYSQQQSRAVSNFKYRQETSFFCLEMFWGQQ
jgi:hypothetical protein